MNKNLGRIRALLLLVLDFFIVFWLSSSFYFLKKFVSELIQKLYQI